MSTDGSKQTKYQTVPKKNGSSVGISKTGTDGIRVKTV